MKIHVASFAYFGLFLAREMARLGHLGMLYTNLPSSRCSEVPRERRRSRPDLVAPYYAAGKLGLQRLQSWLNWPTTEMFDSWVARSMTPCDIFHCFSGFGLRAHRAAKNRYGAMTVVERGSSHIEYQDEILREEHERWGVPYRGIDRRVREKEACEYEECDYITVQSSFARRTFVDKGIPETKLIKLPLSVDLRLFRPVEKRDSVFRVLYAGTMSLRKGIPYLLDAIASLRLPNFEFVVNGTVSSEIEHIVRKHAGNIRFLGTRPFNQLYEVYSQASVLVLPTIEDGFAKVITEAMACGVPVIATTNCSAEDVFADGIEGFIVPIRSAEAIRERIALLYEQPHLRDKMAAAALRSSQMGGGWARYGEAALRAYQQRFSQHKQRDVREAH